MEVFEKYAQLYEQVKSRVGSDEIAAVILDQVGKDGRVERMNGSFDARQSGSGDQMTRKQFGMLKHLGVDIPENCTKQRASELIDEKKAA